MEYSQEDLEEWAAIVLITGWTFAQVRELTVPERNALVKVANENATKG